MRSVFSLNTQHMPIRTHRFDDKGIESTLYKAPRPSARVLTLSHAATTRHDIVWAREPLVQQIGAVGLFV